MTSLLPKQKHLSFLEALRKQRWDDHRYYHHHRINQSLHLVSALSFLTAYVLIAIGDTVTAVLLGWTFAMVSRQIGHFFFEPKGYDDVNRTTHSHKEAIKVGYNLRRKIVLLSLWAAATAVLCFSPTYLGLMEPWTNKAEFLEALSILWLSIAAGAIVFRTVHLFFLADVKTGLVWATKILTDPFHDVKLYHRAPLYVLKGELMDPMTPWAQPTHQG